MKLNRFEVIAALAQGGFFQGPWQLDDATYETISADFMARAWTAWVASLPPQLKIQVDVGGGKLIWVPKWLPEVYDCDDIALDFGVFLDRCMAITAVDDGVPRGNSCSGRFNFALNGNQTTLHCRNWFIDHDGIARQFDAGNCSMPTLLDVEKPSIFFGESI